MKKLLISLESCAAICHEASRAYCTHVKNDNTHEEWDDCGEAYKHTVRNSVLAILKGFTAEQLHEGWRHSRKAEGWKYGPYKCDIKKEHPSMLPYSKLGHLEKLSFILFTQIVLGFTAPEL